MISSGYMFFLSSLSSIDERHKLDWMQRFVILLSYCPIGLTHQIVPSPPPSSVLIGGSLVPIVCWPTTSLCPTLNLSRLPYHPHSRWLSYRKTWSCFLKLVLLLVLYI